MTYLDDIVTYIATAQPEAPPTAWGAVRAAVDGIREHAPEANPELAYSVGCAVAERVAAVLDSTAAADGWSRPGVAGVIGAGAAVGRMMGLDDGELRHLIGLCATQATGLRRLDGTAAGDLQIEKAAADAVEAALLVSNGFTSSADGLTGRRGLFALMAPGATGVDRGE